MPSFISSYQLNKPSKCIAPFYGICETHRFIVGTCSHTGTNDVYFTKRIDWNFRI